MELSEYLLEAYNYQMMSKSEIKVSSNFHGQMSQINKVLKNDKTALIKTLLEFMVNTGNVDFDFQTKDDKLNKLLSAWKGKVNKSVSNDIPMGLRSFTSQYMTERYKSSMIVIRILWENIDGYTLPAKMWVLDGSSIRVKNESKALNTVDYYLGPIKSQNKLTSTDTTTSIIRKPFNQWYDLYPTPFFVGTGALYHAMFKEQILMRQGELITSSFPYQLFIKIGTDAALKKGHVPTEEELKQQLKNFQNLKNNYDSHSYSKGLAGAYPHDVNFEELIPEYEKGLKDALTKSVDKNILSAMGMIELRGFSSNREEAILNPKIMVERIKDAVLDYSEVLKYIVELIKDKNSNKYTFNSEVKVVPGVIKAFVDDNMRNMIRSWYDRGLISQKTAVEDTSEIDFTQQVIERDRERKLNLNERMYPRIIQNSEKDSNQEDFPNEDAPADKQKGSPESNNYFMATVDDIPEEIKAEMNKEETKDFLAILNKFIKSNAYSETLFDEAIEYTCKKMFNL